MSVSSSTTQVVIGSLMLGCLAIANSQSMTEDPCPNLKASAIPADFFETCRPLPITPAEKDLMLALLPTSGEVHKLSPAERRKVAAFDRVFMVHGRGGIYQVKVIDLRMATTALYERFVFLVTRTALDLLSEGELQALAAHEIGHEYVWQQYASAKQRNDTAKLRDLEAICDITAAQALEQLGISTQELINALEKVARYNREHFGMVLNDREYPTTSERRAIITRLTASAGGPKMH